jgi:type IV fimbrial biogenesis protein FimT
MLKQEPPVGTRRSRGFTLVELVIAVAMIGLLMALGVPSFTAWIRNAQVRTVTDGLQAGIRLAQSEAVRRNRAMVFSLTNVQPALNANAAANGKNWSVQTATLQFGTITPAFVQGGALADVASGVTITGPIAICFNANGRLTAMTSANTGVSGECTVADRTYDVTSSNADRPLRVTVGLAGQVRLCDPKRPARSDTSPDGCPA